ncbi:hypothetical protein LPJ57_003157 [Coemansia sp. RSA 486]|nr:hypothetical protein LPJ57_003157 [Coemansia sp. RSA 486]KAJ2235069.1 hypothetical protein IWW45_002892 [Coemansia sp. RSA 485]KAJ2600552.1 hypothetical protein GGF39_001704 [Coemansia sp. RSA 1721]KAJ2637927.1 hypothetical protein GGF40_002025 [Coemansia sp. RSA 1286]
MSTTLQTASDSDKVGRCFSVNSDVGIVRYQGPIEGTRGAWLGVEWITSNRGKHDGSKDGRQYFRCHQPPSNGPHGSFIRPVDRLVFGQTLLQAAKHRYIVDDLSELKDIPQTIDGRRGKIEAVGLDKIAKQQSDLTSLTVLGLDSCRVEGIGSDEHEVKETRTSLRNVCSLSLANNFMVNWTNVEDILDALPKLKTLDISANHIFSPVSIDSTKRYQIDTLRIDTMPLLTWTDVVDISKQLQTKTLSYGWSQLQNIARVPEDWQIEELSLESNLLTDIAALGTLPSLRVLNLRLNPLTTLDIKPSQFPSMHTLNLSHTQIDSWPTIDTLTNISTLRALNVLHTPLTASDVRYQIISRLPQITKLDGTVITEKERTEMERYYLVQCARSVGSSEQQALEMMIEKYPRIRELVQKHGMPGVNSGKQENKLKSRLAKVTIQVVQDDVLHGSIICSESRSLIRNMMVRQLLPVVIKLAKTRIFKVYLCNDAVDSKDCSWTILDNETRSLSFYGIQDGSVLRILLTK